MRVIRFFAIETVKNLDIKGIINVKQNLSLFLKFILYQICNCQAQIYIFK